MEDYRVGRYSSKNVKSAQIISVLSSIAWILLVWLIRIDNTDAIGWFILSVPLLVFFINFRNASKGNSIFEKIQGRGDNISFATVTILVLINWAKPTGQTKNELYKIILTAFILIMLSLINVLSSEENNTNFLLGKGGAQTAGVVLLAFALYRYYSISKETKTSSLHHGLFF